MSTPEEWLRALTSFPGAAGVEAWTWQGPSCRSATRVRLRLVLTLRYLQNYSEALMVPLQSFSGSLWLNSEILRILTAAARDHLDTPRGPPCPSEPAQEIRPDWPDPTAPHKKEELVSTLKDYVTILSNLSLFRKAKLDTKSKIVDTASRSTWESYTNGPGLQWFIYVLSYL